MKLFIFAFTLTLICGFKLNALANETPTETTSAGRAPASAPGKAASEPADSNSRKGSSDTEGGLTCLNGCPSNSSPGEITNTSQALTAKSSGTVTCAGTTHFIANDNDLLEVRKKHGCQDVILKANQGDGTK